MQEYIYLIEDLDGFRVDYSISRGGITEEKSMFRLRVDDVASNYYAIVRKFSEEFAIIDENRGVFAGDIARAIAIMRESIHADHREEPRKKYDAEELISWFDNMNSIKQRIWHGTYDDCSDSNNECNTVLSDDELWCEKNCNLHEIREAGYQSDFSYWQYDNGQITAGLRPVERYLARE